MKLRLSSLFIAIFALSMGNAFAQGQSFIFPEDGSFATHRWFVSDLAGGHVYPVEKMKSILNRYQIQVSVASIDYAFLQDQVLFDVNGKLLIQADMSGSDSTFMQDLTTGVFDEDKRLRRISAEDSTKLGLDFQMLQGTLAEGGGLISGMKNGKPYALVDRGVVGRASEHFQISHDLARKVVASDLGLSLENLIELAPWRGHLDLSIQAFPDGTLLIQDPSQRQSIIQKLLKTRGLSSQEKLQLEKLASASNEDASMQEILDQNAKSLAEQGFRVVRVMGSWSNEINFLNGTVMKSVDGKLLVLTNRANGLPVLERYWATTLTENTAIQSADVHFVGQYSFGAGVDCVGAPAP